MFALVDVNAFYASCEVVFRPDLRGKPVVVLSNNDGCVIARSEAARRLGVEMGVPWFKIRRQAERQGVVAFSSNYGLYADMSDRVMTILQQLTPQVEIYSIDEAFCDLRGLHPDTTWTAFGREVQMTLRRRAHLPVSVGIAPTKTLAKLAQYASKRWPATRGVVDLSDPARQQRLMRQTPVEEVWGIGRRYGLRLRQFGVETAWQLACWPPAEARRHFSVVMERIVRELNGIACLDLEAIAPPKAQILCSRSFGEKLTDEQSVRQAICFHAERAAEKLRAERQACRRVGVFISTSPYEAQRGFYCNQAWATLALPTQDTRDILRAALDALSTLFVAGARYQRAGVLLQDFCAPQQAQLSLFDAGSVHKRSAQLMQTLDRLNQRHKGVIGFAGQGNRHAEAGWKMRRMWLSPAWTTRISDIPRARC